MNVVRHLGCPNHEAKGEAVAKEADGQGASGQVAGGIQECSGDWGAHPSAVLCMVPRLSMGRHAMLVAKSGESHKGNGAILDVEEGSGTIKVLACWRGVALLCHTCTHPWGVMRPHDASEAGYTYVQVEA